MGRPDGGNHNLLSLVKDKDYFVITTNVDHQFPKAVYACLNFNEAYCPVQIEKQSICIDGDSAEVIKQLL